MTDAGITVVSGLATGVDAAAHAATLNARGRTIAVIATGLRHAYPSDNADLQARIAKDGAVISQFPPHTQPARLNFRSVTPSPQASRSQSCSSRQDLAAVR